VEPSLRAEYNRGMEQPTARVINVFEPVTVLESAKLRRFEGGFMLGETTSRDKISRRSKRRAHELLVIDRSDPHGEVPPRPGVRRGGSAGWRTARTQRDFSSEASLRLTLANRSPPGPHRTTIRKGMDQGRDLVLIRRGHEGTSLQ
jgi:hypothetical protein